MFVPEFIVKLNFKIMKTTKSLILALMFLTGAVFFQSCEKEAEIDKEVLESAMEEAVATALFDDIFDQAEMGENALFLKSAETETPNACPTLTISPIGPNFPKTITIDFGSVGCEDEHGNVRKGKIIVIIYGRHFQNGAVKTVSFENFYVNGFKIEGTKTITNMGRKENQNMYWEIVVDASVITSPEGITFRWESTREREWIGGEGTPFFLGDDEFEITGNTTGVNKFQKEFSVTILTPLNIIRNCRFIRKGSVLVQVEGRPDAVLDYGDGRCDNIATITVNDVTKTIRLGR